MKKRRFSCFTLAILALFASLCLVVALAGGSALYLPELAAQTFGPPAPGLDPFQRTYLSALLLVNRNELVLPNEPFGTQKPFQIQLGESTREITRRLQLEGFIPDAAAFRNFLVYAGLDTTLQAGDYKLSPGMTPVQIAQALQDSTPSEVTFHILPGWRIEEIAEALPTSGLTFSPEDFKAAIATIPQDYPFLQDLPPGGTLEGFLFPDTYQLSRSVSVEGFMDVLLKNFENHLSSDLRDGFKRQGLSLYQAVTLASIVQREAVAEDEMSMIASVFLNRLSAGLKLDSDPTVQFALGYNAAQKTWWTNPLSQDDLQVDSPYNTYIVPGLPPGPIANPSLDALRAVAFPAQTPYYYFRAACDNSGRHVFSKTYDEHIQKACPQQ